MHTADLLTPKQQQRLEALFAGDDHVDVELTWAAYQRMIAAYREPDRRHARDLMQAVIDSLATGVPKPLVELARLGRTLKRRAADVLAYFARSLLETGGFRPNYTLDCEERRDDVAAMGCRGAHSR